MHWLVSGRSRGRLLLALLCVWLARPAAAITLESPEPGSFHDAAELAVQGFVETPDPAATTLTLDGVPLVLEEGGALPGGFAALFGATVALDPVAVFNPFLLEATRPDASVSRLRFTVVAGASTPAGEASPLSSALRITAAGLDAFEPAIEALVQLDLQEILPVGRRIYRKCLIDTFAGCAGRARVFIDDPPPSFSEQSVDLAFADAGVLLELELTEVRIDLDIDGSGLVPNCRLRLTADAVRIQALHGLAPDGLDPSRLDLSQLGALAVEFDRFRQNFTGGSCEDALIEDVIDDIVGDLEGEVRDELEQLLEDPDGSGPEDGPLAEAIEDAVAGIEITRPIGDALGVDLVSPLREVQVGVTGLALVTDTAVDARVGGESGCDPPPDAPDPPASYEPAGVVPIPGDLTPGGGLPFDVALSLSDAAFAQGLDAFTVCGLLHSDREELSLAGASFPIDANLLSLIEPAFGALPPDLPLTIQIRPQLAPILGPGGGPQGELASLRIADLRVRIVDPLDGFLWLELAIDATSGLEFRFLPGSPELEVSTSGVLSQVDIVVLGNEIGAEEAPLVETLGGLLEAGTIDVADDLGRLELPRFLGLALVPVEVARDAGGAVFFFEARPVPEPGAGTLAAAVALAVAAVRTAARRRPARAID